MSGILTISPAYNLNFLRFLEYHNVFPEDGGVNPNKMGIGSLNFGYFACKGYPEHIQFYRLAKVLQGGRYDKNPVFGDNSDNTKTFKMPYKYHSDNLWSIPPYIENDFEKCMYNSVDFYTKNYEHVTILYSGGVDSSGIVSAFIKYGDKNKFTVGYTNESIQDYPLFFDYLTTNKFNLIDLSLTRLGNCPGVIIHGNCGDSLLPKVNQASSEGILEKPWSIIIKKEEWEEHTDSLLEFTEKFLKLSGKTAPTVVDLSLFGKTIIRYNYANQHMHYDPDLPVEKVSSFYKTKDFDSWSYYHGIEPLIDSHLPERYKLPLKKVIFSVLKDPNYMKKEKTYSQELWKLKCNTYRFDGQLDYMFIDYTGERIQARSEEEYRTKYGTRFDSYISY